MKSTYEAIGDYYKQSIIISKAGKKFYDSCIYGMDFLDDL